VHDEIPYFFLRCFPSHWRHTVSSGFLHNHLENLLFFWTSPDTLLHVLDKPHHQQYGHNADTRPMSEIKRESLTEAFVRRLPKPGKGNKVYYDNVPGFGIRITVAGTAAFIFNYRVRGTGRERRITIGRFPNWTVGAARKEARRLQQMVDQGGDPLGDIEAERRAPTVGDLCDRFEQEHLPRKRAGTVQAYRLILAKHIRPHFGTHTKVADVTFEDIDALHRKISKSGAPYAANRTLAVLSKMFSLATRWNMRTDNPAKGIGRTNFHVKQQRPQRSAGLLYSLLPQPTEIRAALRTHSCGPEPANVAAFPSSLCEAEDQIGAVPYPHNVQRIESTHGPRC
jgi:Arm DNA-binding domain